MEVVLVVDRAAAAQVAVKGKAQGVVMVQRPAQRARVSVQRVDTVSRILSGNPAPARPVLSAARK